MLDKEARHRSLEIDFIARASGIPRAACVETKIPPRASAPCGATRQLARRDADESKFLSNKRKKSHAVTPTLSVFWNHQPCHLFMTNITAQAFMHV
jgi:hypothetical protein